VIGVLAARVRERYQRPTIAFAVAEEGRLRGSARSVEGLHIRDLIDAVDKCRPGLIERLRWPCHGCGVELACRGAGAFREILSEEARCRLGDVPPMRELVSDGELPARALNSDTTELLRTAGPWGHGFPEPLFDGWFEVLDRRMVGERHLKLRLRPPGGDGIDAIGFDLGDSAVSTDSRVRVVYRLEVNHYRDVRSPQLIVEHLEQDDAEW